MAFFFIGSFKYSAPLVSKIQNSDSFNFIKRTPGRCEVTNGTHTAIGLPMFDGGSTSSNGLEGPHGSLNTDDVIAITQYGSSTDDELSINLNEARKKNKHPAIVAIADVYPNIPGLAVLNAESYRNPYGPPVLQVGTQEGEWLMRLKADEKISVSIELIDESTLRWKSDNGRFEKVFNYTFIPEK